MSTTNSATAVASSAVKPANDGRRHGRDGRYQRARGAAEDAGVSAAVIARRAERRLGELVKEMPKAKGTRNLGGRSVRPPAAEPPTLADHGITKSDSSRWQAMAAVPEKKFDEAMKEAVAKKKPPTRAAIAPTRRAGVFETFTTLHKG